MNIYIYIYLFIFLYRNIMYACMNYLWYADTHITRLWKYSHTLLVEGCVRGMILFTLFPFFFWMTCSHGDVLVAFCGSWDEKSWVCYLSTGQNLCCIVSMIPDPNAGQSLVLLRTSCFFLHPQKLTVRTWKWWFPSSESIYFSRGALFSGALAVSFRECIQKGDKLPNCVLSRPKVFGETNIAIEIPVIFQ